MFGGEFQIKIGRDDSWSGDKFRAPMIGIYWHPVDGATRASADLRIAATGLFGNRFTAINHPRWRVVPSQDQRLSLPHWSSARRSGGAMLACRREDFPVSRKSTARGEASQNPSFQKLGLWEYQFALDRPPQSGCYSSSCSPINCVQPRSSARYRLGATHQRERPRFADVKNLPWRTKYVQTRMNSSTGVIPGPRCAHPVQVDELVCK